MSTAPANTPAPIGRRTFLCTAALALVSIATDAQALEQDVSTDTDKNDGAVELAYLTSAGGGNYPFVQAEDPSLAHPLDGTFDDFEPLVSQEDGGVRVATPFYSVFVPDELFPDGFSTSYNPSMPTGVWASGNLMGHSLSIDSSDGSTNIDVRVTTSSWDGVQGDWYISPSVGPLAVDPSFHVGIVGLINHESDPFYEQAYRDLYPTYRLVSTHIVAAPSYDGSWRIVEVEQTLPSVFVENTTDVVTTPWYSVRIDPLLWPHRLRYRYYNEQVELSQIVEPNTQISATESGFLAFFDAGEAGDEAVPLCWVFTYEGARELIESLNGLTVYRYLGQITWQPGLGVYLAVPTGDSSIEAYQELAARYAACIDLL